MPTVSFWFCGAEFLRQNNFITVGILTRIPNTRIPNIRNLTRCTETCSGHNQDIWSPFNFFGCLLVTISDKNSSNKHDFSTWKKREKTYHDNLDEKIVYFFKWEKNLFWTNKKFVVYLIFINNIVISSQNMVQKDMNKFFSFVFLVRSTKFITVGILTRSSKIRNPTRCSETCPSHNQDIWCPLNFLGCLLVTISDKNSSHKHDFSTWKRKKKNRLIDLKDQVSGSCMYPNSELLIVHNWEAPVHSAPTEGVMHLFDQN